MSSFDKVKGICQKMNGSYDEQKFAFRDEPMSTMSNKCQIGAAELKGWRSSDRVDLSEGDFDFVFQLDEAKIWESPKTSYDPDRLYLRGGKGKIYPYSEGNNVSAAIDGGLGISAVEVQVMDKNSTTPILTVFRERDAGSVLDLLEAGAVDPSSLTPEQKDAVMREQYYRKHKAKAWRGKYLK